MKNIKIHFLGKVIIGISIILAFILLGWAGMNVIGDKEGDVEIIEVVDPFKCKTCLDSGIMQMKCTVCKGAKTNRCKECSGTGKTRGIIWGENLCKTCEGRGKTVCLVCDGKGELKLDCPNCNRSGTL